MGNKSIEKPAAQPAAEYEMWFAWSWRGDQDKTTAACKRTCRAVHASSSSSTVAADSSLCRFALSLLAQTVI